MNLTLAKILDGLFQNGMIQFGKFTLTDKTESSIYVNLRHLRSTVLLRSLVVNELFAQINRYDQTDKIKINHLADIPISISPIVSILAYVAGMSQITPRPPKGYGTKASIEGIFKPGQTVLLIDDVITSAKSKFEAIKTFEDAGLLVNDVLVIVDREQGGEEELACRGYKLAALFKLSDILEYYLEKGMIPKEKYDEVRKELWNK